MNDFGTQAYRRVGLDARVGAADPYELVLMLFDGALEAMRQAEAHIAGGRIAEKGQALGKAVRIVEEGLKASLDREAGGALAQQLAALYDYAALRLLQVNLRNDRKALAEVSALLAELRGAWASIGAARTPAQATDESAPRLAVTA